MTLQDSRIKGNLNMYEIERKIGVITNFHISIVIIFLHNAKMFEYKPKLRKIEYLIKKKKN